MSRDEKRRVSASELVEDLANGGDCKIEIRRNGKKESPIAGELISASLSSISVDGAAKEVVHLLIRRATRDATTPVMVSLVTGVDPDEDFFWPVCPIDVTRPDGVERLMLA